MKLMIKDWYNDNFVVMYVKRNRGILIAFALLCIILTVTTKTFFTQSNLFSVLRQVSINAILSFAMTLVLIIGCIDLTVGAVTAVSGCLTVLLILKGIPIGPCVLAGILLGTVFGAINGLLVSRTSIPSFIVTLAMTSVIRGTGYIITEAKPVVSNNETFNAIGNGFMGPFPIPVLIVIILLIIAALILARTRFGRRMYATGGNKEAAIYAGINVKHITFIVYIIAGTLSGIAGVVLSSRIYSGQPTAGVGYEGDAIAAAVLGGVSFNGGVGSIGGVIIGVLLIGVMNNGLNLIEVPYYWQYVVKGIVIVIAVYLDTLKNRKT